MSALVAPGFGSHWQSRSAAVATVALVHVGLLIGLLQWRGVHATHESAPLQVQLLAELPLQAEPLPPRRPVLEPLQIQAIVPEISITLAPEPNAITVTEAPRPVPATGGEKPVLVTDVEYLNPPQPRYPHAARKRRQEGTVVVGAVVDAYGRAASVEVRTSSGHPMLDEAALEAVRAARFRPYLVDGIARAVMVLVPIEFGLNGRVARNERGRP